MYLTQGFEVALVPQNLIIALIGCFVGTIVGLLPGLGPINGVAILLPLAFALKLPAESALILLATVYIGCEYGGRISSILLNVPGDAAAIMTALDGYPMAQQGRAGVALSISAVSSFVGSMIAIGGIILFAPLLARWSPGLRPGGVFCPDGVRHRLPRQHDEPKPAEIPAGGADRPGAGDGGRRRQHRRLPLYL
ncbi:tripartite tricarboxylate transporter permease [Serratia ureilytica]